MAAEDSSKKVRFSNIQRRFNFHFRANALLSRFRLSSATNVRSQLVQ
jgi:hypothetical protein